MGGLACPLNAVQGTPIKYWAQAQGPMLEGGGGYGASLSFSAVSTHTVRGHCGAALKTTPESISLTNRTQQRQRFVISKVWLSKAW